MAELETTARPFDPAASSREAGSTANPAEESALEQELSLAFAPLHKRCLGVAVGVAMAALVVVATLVHLARSPSEEYPLALLRQYFWGYSVSLPGALAGAFWGFWLGFVLGWFFAFCRNIVLAVTVFFVRARAELAQTRGFLDHI
jgi:hypothetical protein